MAFWGQQDLKEPLRQNRWYIRITSVNNQEANSSLENLLFAIKECKKPEFEINVVEHKLLTHTFRFPGTLKWKPITMKFISTAADNLENNSAADFFQQYLKENYIKPTEGQQQISKIGIERDTLRMEIIQVNEEGKEIEKWTLNNSFISDVNYGTLSYANDDFVEITCTVQYDWADLETKPPVSQLELERVRRFTAENADRIQGARTRAANLNNPYGPI